MTNRGHVLRRLLPSGCSTGSGVPSNWSEEKWRTVLVDKHVWGDAGTVGELRDVSGLNTNKGQWF